MIFDEQNKIINYFILRTVALLRVVSTRNFKRSDNDKIPIT